MALTKLTANLNNVSALSDSPNIDDGLTSTQLKAVFDKAGDDIKTFVNSTLTVEADATFATKTELATAVLSGISDDSITNTKLATDVKVGSLAALDTQVTTDVVSALNSLMPVGSVIMWAKATPPTNYLECNGDVVSRTTYANLFAIIGTTFGEGDTSTTFGLPDLRGEFIRGWDNGKGVDTGRIIGSSQTASQLLSWGTSVVSPSNYDTVANTNSGATVSTGASGSTSRTTIPMRPRNIALMYCIRY